MVVAVVEIAHAERNVVSIALRSASRPRHLHYHGRPSIISNGPTRFCHGTLYRRHRIVLVTAVTVSKLPGPWLMHLPRSFSYCRAPLASRLCRSVMNQCRMPVNHEVSISTSSGDAGISSPGSDWPHAAYASLNLSVLQCLLVIQCRPGALRP